MRPTISYIEQGNKAFTDGKSQDQCPYKFGSVRFLEWRTGWNQMLYISLDRNEGAQDVVSNTIKHLRIQTDVIHSRIADMVPDMDTLQKVVGPFEKWVFNCYGVASTILKSGVLQEIEDTFGPIKLCHGMFRGEIAPNSPFKTLLAQHGWLELEDGIVIDPTYWVFEGVEPYVRVASINDYDLGATDLKRRVLKNINPPEFGEIDAAVKWHDSDPFANDAVDNLLGTHSHIKDGLISKQQAFWLANLPLDVLGEQAPNIYRALENMKMAAFIPIDNREYVKDLVDGTSGTHAKML